MPTSSPILQLALMIMNVDPLSDTIPPRYAIESDEEEDEYNPLRLAASTELNETAEVELRGTIPKDRELVIATGYVAKYWAHGVDLGDQSGSVHVNNIEVGLIFQPKWTKATVIISEAVMRLPVWAMHPYATSILDELRPTKVSLLDTYPVPSYISEKPIPVQDAPLRYLATFAVPAAVVSNVEAEPFSPPNLIQSTSASFVLVSSTTHSDSQVLLTLIPSPHMSRPSPKNVEHSNFRRLFEDRFEWPAQIINSAQDVLFRYLDGQAPPRWAYTGATSPIFSFASKGKSMVGEGGMYI